MDIIKSKHVGCYGIVINNKNEVLLIRKSRGAYKGKLDLPGGRIEYGETAEQTLKREFIEEVGVAIKSFDLYTIKTNYVVWQMEENIKEDLQHIAIIYKVSLDEEDLDKIKQDADGHDSLGAKWYKVDELKIEELSPLAVVIKEKI